VTYRIPLPAGGRTDRLDIVEPNSTAVQRFLRRDGLCAYEPPTIAALLALFEQADPGFTFFDVGANMGLYALVAATMFESAHVHAFEPTPSTVRVLRKVVSANDAAVDVIDAATSDTTGTAMLHFSNASDASNSLVAGFKDSRGGTEVMTIRVDDHVRQSGVRPDIMKIDVETFEPAVLHGARHTIETARPYIVIEVLNRRGHDHGEEITAAMAEHGYVYYRLGEEPDWSPRDVVTGTPGSRHNDWLLAPGELDDAFPELVARWRTRLSDCTPERNSRVPIGRSVAAAMRRGGVSEVVATVKRYAASVRRERDRPSS